MPNILIQAGHNPPRQPGFETETGAVGEMEFTKLAADKVLWFLAKDPNFFGHYAPGLVPDSPYFDGAVYLHCDSSNTESVGGHSYGYPNPSHAFANSVEGAFRDLAHEKDAPESWLIRRDNYTPNESEYYAFRHVQTHHHLLIEMFFISNPLEYEFFRNHSTDLARAIYHGIAHYFNYTPTR